MLYCELVNNKTHHLRRQLMALNVLQRTGRMLLDRVRDLISSTILCLTILAQVTNTIESTDKLFLKRLKRIHISYDTSQVSDPA